MEDFDQELFPNAKKVHWRVLISEVEKYKKSKALEEKLAVQQHRRLKQVETSKFKGVRMKFDSAMMTFGKCFQKEAPILLLSSLAAFA